jgi:GNAT superfamily N-acetyltransferase
MSNLPNEIRFARPGEVDAVLAILHEVRLWLADSGKKLWEERHIDTEAMREHGERGEIIVALEASEIIGTILMQTTDPHAWPESDPGEALYLHRMGVARAASGRGWGKRIISWAADYAKNAGVAAIRLDCVPRAQLMGMYASVGFSVAGTFPVRRFGYTLVRMQKVFSEN